MNRQTRWQKSFRILVIAENGDLKRRMISHCTKFFARDNTLVVIYSAGCVDETLLEIERGLKPEVIVFHENFPGVERLRLKRELSLSQPAIRLIAIAPSLS